MSNGYAIDGKTLLISSPGQPLLVRAVDFNTEISRLQSANMELAEALRKIIAKDIEPVSAFNHADWRKLLGNARAALARHTTTQG